MRGVVTAGGVNVLSLSATAVITTTGVVTSNASLVRLGIALAILSGVAVVSSVVFALRDATE